MFWDLGGYGFGVGVGWGWVGEICWGVNGIGRLVWLCVWGW